MTLKKVCTLAGLLLAFGHISFALQPGFNVQGRLTDADGNPKAGPVTLTFSVYQNLTDDPPVAPIWIKTLPGTLVANGNFQVLLEGAGDPPYATIENAVRDLPGAFVEVKVETEAPMAPRLPLVKSAFSSTDRVFGQNDVLLHSETGNLSLKTGSSEKIVVLNNGNVGVGTPAPDQKLTVNGSIKITDGTQGLGKVLTSGADGKASWAEIAAGGDSAEQLVYSHVFDGAESSLSIPIPKATAGMYSIRLIIMAITFGSDYQVEINPDIPGQLDQYGQPSSMPISMFMDLKVTFALGEFFLGGVDLTGGEIINIEDALRLSCPNPDVSSLEVTFTPMPIPAGSMIKVSRIF